MTQTKQNVIKSKSQKGFLYGILATVLFAAYLLTNRYVYTTYRVDTLSYVVTFTIWAAFFALLGVAYHRYKQRFVIFGKGTFPVVLTGMLAGIGVGLIVLGQRYTTAINASIIATASIVPTVVFSRLMLKEVFSRFQYAWLTVMFAGLYLAIVGIHTLSLNKGDAIIMSSAVILGFTNTFSKVLMRTHNSDFVADVRLVSGGLLFIILGAVFRGDGFLVTSAGLWPILAGLFYWLTIKFFYASVNYINPGKATVLVNAHPIITPIVGIFVLSEPYGLAKLLGSVLILVSIYFINKSSGSPGGNNASGVR